MAVTYRQGGEHRYHSLLLIPLLLSPSSFLLPTVFSPGDFLTLMYIFCIAVLGRLLSTYICSLTLSWVCSNISRACFGSDLNSLCNCCACLFWIGSWWLHLLDPICNIRRDYKHYFPPYPSCFPCFLPLSLEAVIFPSWRIITCLADPHLWPPLLSCLNTSCAQTWGQREISGRSMDSFSSKQ